jgi:hypothetical protein
MFANRETRVKTAKCQGGLRRPQTAHARFRPQAQSGLKLNLIDLRLISDCYKI